MLLEELSRMPRGSVVLMTELHAITSYLRDSPTRLRTHISLPVKCRRPDAWEVMGIM